jgi:hypothetical protein
MAVLLYKLSIIVVLEYLVLLFFFKKEWLPCLQFAALANAITFTGGLLLFSKVGLGFFTIIAITAVVEAVGIYFFWIVRPAKAAAASVVANIVSGSFFPIMAWLGINVSPF